MSEALQEPRNVVVVALQLIMLLPDEVTEFKKDLKKFIDDCAYRSPEMLNHVYVWNELGIIFNKHIGQNDREWKNKAIDLYTGRTSVSI
jgi:hypothetical protein